MIQRPLLKAILSQLVAALILLLLIIYGRLGEFVSPPIALLLQGGVAALLGRFMGLALWWIPLHLILPIAVWFAMGLQLPAWGYMAAFLLMLLVFWNSAGERVPLYLSNLKTWEALAGLLPDKPGIRFVDLGSGLAGTLAHLAAQREDGHFVGVESAPLPSLISWLRFRFKPMANVELVHGDIWKQSLADFDVVYCFLSSEPMPKLYVKARKEMQPGSIFVSNSFEVPGVEPHEVIQLDDRRQTRLFIWRM